MEDQIEGDRERKGGTGEGERRGGTRPGLRGKKQTRAQKEGGTREKGGSGERRLREMTLGLRGGMRRLAQDVTVVEGERDDDDDQYCYYQYCC